MGAGVPRTIRDIPCGQNPGLCFPISCPSIRRLIKYKESRGLLAAPKPRQCSLPRLAGGAFFLCQKEREAPVV